MAPSALCHNMLKRPACAHKSEQKNSASDAKSMIHGWRQSDVTKLPRAATSINSACLRPRPCRIIHTADTHADRKNPMTLRNSVRRKHLMKEGAPPSTARGAAPIVRPIVTHLRGFSVAQPAAGLHLAKHPSLGRRFETLWGLLDAVVIQSGATRPLPVANVG